MGSEHKADCICGRCEDRRNEVIKLRAENARLEKTRGEYERMLSDQERELFEKRAENARLLALAESRADQIFKLDVENARLREALKWIAREAPYRSIGIVQAAARDALEGKGTCK